jgi:hypothetical protein
MRSRYISDVTALTCMQNSSQEERLLKKQQRSGPVTTGPEVASATASGNSRSGGDNANGKVIVL